MSIVSGSDLCVLLFRVFPCSSVANASASAFLPSVGSDSASVWSSDCSSFRGYYFRDFLKLCYILWDRATPFGKFDKKNKNDYALDQLLQNS